MTSTSFPSEISAVSGLASALNRRCTIDGLLATIEGIAGEKGATPAQVSLAWVMAQGLDIVPIPGCKSRSHLEDNLRALELELSSEDLVRLDALMPPDAATGAREQVYRSGS